MIASENGHKEVISILLVNGADVNWKDEVSAACVLTKLIILFQDGWTPLHFASYTGNTEVVSVLIANGADVNWKNKVGILYL